MSLPGYDAWKTREPDDGWLEPIEDDEPAEYEDRLGWDPWLGWLDDDWQGWEPHA